MTAHTPARRLATPSSVNAAIKQIADVMTTKSSFVQTKRKLLDETDLWCIVSLPPGVFSSAGAGVKTNLLFFTKGGPTERTWYFDLSDVKVTKKQPLTLDRFDELFGLAESRADSPRSWTVTREEIEARGYDLKAVNPTAKAPGDTRTPLELLDEIETRGREVDAALTRLRALLADEAQ
jgi:type I restriction enzyme M protein